MSSVETQATTKFLETFRTLAPRIASAMERLIALRLDLHRCRRKDCDLCPKLDTLLGELSQTWLALEPSMDFTALGQHQHRLRFIADVAGRGDGWPKIDKLDWDSPLGKLEVDREGLNRVCLVTPEGAFIRIRGSKACGKVWLSRSDETAAWQVALAARTDKPMVYLRRYNRYLERATNALPVRTVGAFLKEVVPAFSAWVKTQEQQHPDLFIRAEERVWTRRLRSSTGHVQALVLRMSEALIQLHQAAERTENARHRLQLLRRDRSFQQKESS